MSLVLHLILRFYPELLRNLAKSVSDNSADPYAVTQATVEFFSSQYLQSPVDYELATVVFKHDVPENYYEDWEWNLDWETVPIQVAALLEHIARLPEFQLM